MITRLLFFVVLLIPQFILGQAAASFNYASQTGSLGTTYSWIDCSSGTAIVTGDDEEDFFSWPFEFSFYDNTYTTSDNLSVSTNGFICLDGTASSDFQEASDYSLSSSSTELGQVIALAVSDAKVGDNSGWVKYVVTGSSPNRILTVEYNNLEINYNAEKYADVQVSFYETSNLVVLKLGDDDITTTEADMGIHSGVSGFADKWQEVSSGANNTWIEYTPSSLPSIITGPQASWNYDIQTGTTGSTYSWIDCSAGSSIVTGDDEQSEINWPFDFSYYDNYYTTSDLLSVSTNGFIRMDGTATSGHSTATSYDLTSTATTLGQIIAMGVYDAKVGDNGGWVKSLVTGTTPNQIFTIEYNNLEIAYNNGKYADVQVSFYESTNIIVLKLGTENLSTSGADIGLHSGVNNYFDQWQEVKSGTDNTWIEYTPKNIEVSATIGASIAYYPTLKDAFDEINDGTHQGNITVKVNHSTTEIASAKLNASGEGSSNYSAVNIYPTAANLSIGGDLTSAIIDLYGADNVTIDGRINLGGTVASLTITNANTYKYAYAIRFRESAETNIVRYSYLKASSLGYGVVRFEGSRYGNGCDNNIIEYCNITNSGNPLVRAIYSSGSDGRENSGNIIRYNNIYDFFNPGSTSYGISLGWKSTGWTVTGNSLYQTTTVVPTGTYRYYALDISQGDDNIISDNYIGGSAPQCGGATPFTIEAMVPYYFCGIYISGGTAGYIQDNVISNFKFINSEDNPWDGIFINSGNVDVTGNTIGSGIGNNSITIATPVAVATATIVDGVVTELTLVDGGSGYNDAVPPTVKFSSATATATATTTVVGGVITALNLTSGGSGYTSAPRVTFDGQSNYSTSHGIIQNSSGTVNITGNAIGSITTVGSDYYTHGFETVYVRSGPSITNIRNNIIGSETTANSIHVSSTAAFATIKQDLYGLYSANKGTTIISGNTVANLTNAYVAATSGAYCRGIRTTEGTNTIQNNSVRDVSIAGGSGYSLIGIQQNSDVAGQIISGNEVCNLSNLNSDAVEVDVYGIYFRGPTSGTNAIDGNFIHDISLSSTNIRSSMIGIYFYMGYSTCSNNIINIGESSTLGYIVAGIWDDRGLNDCYFNTIYIGGSVSSGETKNTGALWNQYNFNPSNYRNNILVNARSGGSSGNHFAIHIAGLNDVIVDYNDYYVSGTGGILGELGSSERTSLTEWQSATSQDASSLNADPGFTSAGGSNTDDYVSSASLPGVAISGITTTYHGITRIDPPKMGALEVSPTFTWQGDDSEDFATASNWAGGIVPPDGADLEFAANPDRDCYLDQNRTLNNITNVSSKKLVLNAHELTITGDIVSATTNQIEASDASSAVIFAGTAAQSISTGVFVNNTIDALTLNNAYGLLQNGDVIVSSALTLVNGDYGIGANTLTINGDISTTSGSLTGGSTSNISIGGSGASSELPGVSLNGLTLNRANGMSLGGAVSVASTLALTDGSLTVGPNTLTISGNSITRVSGNIDASNAAATLVFANSSAITLGATLFSGNLNNLTINGAGLTASSHLTIDGILELQSANPSLIKGSLDMSDYTLTMGAMATTVGLGDVTGKVKRTTILANVEYTFGHQFSSVTFFNVGTLPTEVTLKISIGATPTWKTDGVKRIYDISQIGGSETSTILKTHYLDNELNGNNEIDLSYFGYIFSPPTVLDRGLSEINTTENWILLNNVNFSNLPSVFGAIEHGLGVSTSNVITWTGSLSTDWDLASNWTPVFSPDSTKIVVIPDASTTPRSPVISDGVSDTISTLTIQSGGVLTAGDGVQLYIKGAGGAWSNNGTFTANTSKIIFDNGNGSELVTISGTTDFYDIEIAANTMLQPVAGCVSRIAGAVSTDVTSSVDFSALNTTVEWNGADQTIFSSIGINGNSNYFKLILSGSGIKTMPATAMLINDELEIAGTASVTAAAALNIRADLIILDDATFITGAFNDTIGGAFDNSGTFIATSGSSITLNGTAVQEIYGDSSTTFENLIINNSAGIDIYRDVTINDELTLASGNLNVGSTTLSINGELNKSSGFINVTSLSSLSFGGTTALSLANDLFYTTPSIDTLIIDRSGGVVFESDLTINGELNLQGENPVSGIIGSLDMGINTLNMGAAATTVGLGDVTGKVKRSTFLPNVEYTFGHSSSSILFANVGTLPTEVTLKISIGATPSWKTDGIKRIYDISQIGGSGTRTILKTHYLDNELNGNRETSLSYFGYIISSSTLLDRGLSEINTDENWILLNNVDFSHLPSEFETIEHGLGVSTSNVITWNGSVSTDWDNASNWTPVFSPDSTKIVIIPHADSTDYDPLLAAYDSISTLSIRTGGILNAAENTELIIFGAGGAWYNNGIFNASTSNVIFDHGDLYQSVTVSGITDFYNIQIGANTTFVPVPGTTFRIAGVATVAPTSQSDWSAINCTVEWNGVNQNIINPQGIGGNSGYYNLILSGSGIKTMPSSAMIIRGDFSTSGTVTATAADYLLISGDLTIGSGSTFGTGDNNNLLAGNFENNGTFIASTGGTVVFNDTLLVQTIGGSSTTDFENLIIDNEFGVTQESDINVNDVLTLNKGFLSVGANELGINGTISNPSAYIDLSSLSNLSFGGSNALTLNDNLFNGNSILNNLAINRADGVILGNENMTVNGTLTLTDGIFTLAANTLTLSGTSPTRISGMIDASHAFATLEFTNSSAVTLPSSLFDNNVNNLTLNGAGGVSSGGDISINNVLDLQSSNPSSIKGSLDMGTDTLHMGVNATTTGVGDVTGFVKREHTFSNGVDYSFGNPYTTLNFLDVTGSTKPTWIICKIKIGEAPTWRGEAINRFYSFAQSGGNDRMIVKLHYLDTELHGVETDEAQLVFWDAYNPDLITPNSFSHYFPRNHNETNTNNNWVQLTGPAINYLATSDIIDVKQWGLAYTNVSKHKWIGLGSPSYPGDWSLPGHWEGGVPQAGDSVLIPASLLLGNSGYPYQNLLPVIAPATAGSIEIEAGAILTSDGYDITVSGRGLAWINDGVFIPGTGTVIFNHGDDGELVNLVGTTNFNNLTIEDKTYIEAESNSITRIAGTFSAHSGSILDFTTHTNTVEYNGSVAQIVANPTNANNSGYYNLILDGTGTKILPAVSVSILGDLTSNASISAIGNTLVMNGTTSQNILGSVDLDINNFTNANTTAAVTADVNINCLGTFTNSGELDMTTYALGVVGSVSNSGTVKTASLSSTPLPEGKVWGGTVQHYATTGGQTLVDGTYNTLTLSNTSGTQSASGAISVTTLNNTSNVASVLDMLTYDLDATALNNSGTIQTQSLSETPINSELTIGGTVNYNATTGGQTVVAETSYSTLTMGNTSGTQSVNGNIVANTLNTTSGGTLDMVTYALSGLTTVSHLGTLRTQNTSSTPFTSGLSWGGTIIFDATVGQTLPAAESTFDSLILGNTAGVTAAADQTVNGVLNLSVANPAATLASLDMSTYTLNLGASSTTVGIGDVSGIVKRTHPFVENTTYTFGNANQYVIFPVVSGQTIPTSLSLRITLLTEAPNWVTGATKRLYEIAQTGGINTKATFRVNYLDSELASGVEEGLLSFWQSTSPYSSVNASEKGWADYNTEENWITISDADFGDLSATLGEFSVIIAPTQSVFRTWNGSTDTTWNTANNWTPQGVPTASLGVVIPDVASSNLHSPALSTDAVGRYLIIQNGGILNAVTDANLSLYGNGNTWSLESGATFNAGNSNVSFVGDTDDGVVRVSGETDFYNLTIADTTTFRPGVDAYIGIAGALNNNGIFDAATNHNTIEFKQAGDYAILNPNGSSPGFHSLIISGAGTKTLPPTLNVWHDFTNNGTVAAGSGNVIFNGLHCSQLIAGSSNTVFYDLTVANTGWELITMADITVNNNLTINSSATLTPGVVNTVGGSGTLTGHGEIKVNGLGVINSLCTQYSITTKDLTNLTVDYNGEGDQTICAADYGDLIISPNESRTVTLASSGIIGVNGVFDPDNTLTDYIVTGSTMDANGTGAQTVQAFNYYNVIVSGDRGGATVTLVNGGTIGIAGHGSVTATNVDYDNTNNTIDINGSGAQNLDKFSFYYLKISNSGIKTALDSLTVSAGCTIDEGLTLDMATSPLLGEMGTISNSGVIKTSNTSVAPIPVGKTWNGSVEYGGSSPQTVVAGIYQKLIMSGAGGGTLGGDLSVNEVLNLSHVNPSSTQGILHTGSDTLFMAASAITSGVGDVTGIVKRQHTFGDSVEYTFGNEFTSLNFIGVPGGIKPTWVECKITIGTAPTWRSTAIKRNYSFAQSGGNDRMIVKLHYLDTELHGVEEVDESQLVFWDAYNPDLVTPNDFTHLFPRNHNATDASNNWIQLTGPAIDYLATSSTLDVKQWGLAYTNVDTITWIGLGSPSYPGDWSLPGHWDGGVPRSDNDVLIDALPDGSAGYPYRNLLPVASPSIVKSLKIGTDATVTLNDFDITISGDGNAWVNNGTFNAGTNAVIFNNGNTSNTVVIAGNTNFYDISVSDNTNIQSATDNVLRIGGTLSINSGSILDFSSNVNTVVYNGNDDQSILNPVGGTLPGYYNLNLSSSGSKILPSTLNVLGDFSINADMKYAGNTIVMSGTSSQTISGSAYTIFNNLTIDNAAGVSLNMDQLCTVRGILQINSGKKMQVAAAKQLTVSGILSNDAGVAGLVLQSSTSGTASLLHETDDVPATVERMITGAAEDWHFLSSPVSNQLISGDWLPTGTYGDTTGYDMYLWNEPSNCWIYQQDSSRTVNWATTHPSASFVAGKGYLYSVQANTPTKEFAGNLNNDDVTYALTIDGSADLTLQGFNLVGNPYPSSIDWMASSGWTRDMLVTSGSNIGNDMWIWNPAAGNYGVCNSATGDGTNSVTRYIAPMQGFFVRARSAGNMVSSNNVRVHDETTLWKSSHIELNRITAVVRSESDKTSDEVRLLFGYQENNAGAAKLFSPLEAAPSLYCPEGDAHFSIRYLSDTIDNPNVPVSFKAGRDGEYSINFDFNSNDFEIVILEDKQTNEFVDLTLVSDYSFSASTRDNEDRFRLHFSAVKSGEDLGFPARIYSDRTDLILDLLLVANETNVTVCDLTGKLLLREVLTGENQYKFHFNGDNRIIVVYLSNANGRLSKKVFLKRY